jgi:hypothetical protein
MSRQKKHHNLPNRATDQTQTPRKFALLQLLQRVIGAQLFKKTELIFWLVFLCVPVFTGWLDYQSLPDEFYDPTRHELLKSHMEEAYGSRLVARSSNRHDFQCEFLFSTSSVRGKTTGDKLVWIWSYRLRVLRLLSRYERTVRFFQEFQKLRNPQCGRCHFRILDYLTLSRHVNHNEDKSRPQAR